MIPFFPVEAASRGVSQKVISGVFSSYGLVRMVMSPVVGRLASAVGVTRLYSAGLTIAGLTTVVFGTFAHIPDTSVFVAACFLARAVEAVDSTTVLTCSYTIVSSQFPSRVNMVMALLSSSTTVGLAFTTAIWGCLFSVGGFGLPFYTLGVILLLAGLATQRLLPAVEDSSDSRPDFCRSLRVFAGSVDNWLCMATLFMFAVDIVTVQSAIAPYASATLGLTPSQIGLFFLVATGMFAVFNFFWGWLASQLRTPYGVMSLCLLSTSSGILSSC